MSLEDVRQLFGLKPLAVILLVSITGLAGIPAGVLLISFMTPTAPSTYILAGQLGGDIETMSSIITFQTLLAFLVMPAIGFFMLS
jgi:malonate transporter